MMQPRWQLKKRNQSNNPKKKKKKPKKASIQISNNEELIAVLVKIVNNVPSDQHITSARVGEKLLDLIGESWNKKYKKTYGSIKTYLEAQTEFFIVDKDDHVTLKTQEHDEQAIVDEDSKKPKQSGKATTKPKKEKKKTKKIG